MEGQAEQPRKAGMAPPPQGPGGDAGSAVEDVSFVVLFKRYLPFVKHLLWLRNVPKRDRNDVAQEVWIRVYASLDRYDPDRLFEPWLRTIVLRAVADYFKRADVRRERLSEEGEVETQAAPRMEDRMIDASRTLETALAQLNDEHREVFVLGEIEDMNPAEIAEALGGPVNTVHSRLSRAREQFARAVERIRAAEQKRHGAALVLPAFLLDWRALAEHGREIPPVSRDSAEQIWQGVLRGLEALEAAPVGAHRSDATPPDGGARATVPPLAPSLPPGAAAALPRALARLPWWSSPVGLASALIAGGLGGGGLVYWLLREPEPPPPIIARLDEPTSTGPVSAAAPATSDSTVASPAPSPPPDAGAGAYDTRDELATLQAAYSLFFQGKCKAAREKLGARIGRAHAQDYKDLRRKIDACLAGDGGIP
jgi:RNA polymerase sigma-70 factor (ECF subfamily)